MKYGVSIISRGDAAGRETFAAMAARAEDIGLDALWVSDHVILPRLHVSRYPGRADGQLPEAWRRTYYHPFSVLGFLAARTETIRLGTSVLILPMRNPIEVAGQVADLDQLSGGRINFGVGVGWNREEFEALGHAFERRGAHADEGLAIIKTLWSEAEADFEGDFYRFKAAALGPKPVQAPHPPIYIGGNSAAALARVARFGDVWHPFKLSPEGLAEARPALATALAAEGRSAEGFKIAPKVALTFQDGPPGEGQEATEGRVQDIVDALQRFRDAGATEFCFDIRVETRENARDILDRFADEVRPKL